MIVFNQIHAFSSHPVRFGSSGLNRRLTTAKKPAWTGAESKWGWHYKYNAMALYSRIDTMWRGSKILSF